jgi:hypothetical protein
MDITAAQIIEVFERGKGTEEIFRGLRGLVGPGQIRCGREVNIFILRQFEKLDRKNGHVLMFSANRWTQTGWRIDNRLGPWEVQIGG